MDLNQRDRIARGAFADIFAPPPGDRVYKLFRRLDDPHLKNVAPHVFRAEVGAYAVAHRDPYLAQHVPGFFGPVAIGSVCSDDGAQLNDKYWLNLCYAMQRLAPDPEERKLGSFFNESEWHLMSPLEQRFEAAGIRHVGDASVLYWRSGNPVLIDFGLTDAAADHAEIPRGAA